MNKIVLVTGSNGLLGQKLIERLCGRTAVTLIAVSSGENRFPFSEGYHYESADISDSARMSEIFEKWKPTEIIHAAAMTNVDACEREPAECQRVNVAATAKLILLCEEFKTKMIYVSTDFIFDGLSGPYNETDAANPISVYGKSKLDAEKLVQASGSQWAIVRTVLIYGVMYGSQRSNFVLWAKNMLEEGKEVPAVSDELRSPTLAEDLANGIALVLMKDKTGIFHISGAEVNTIAFFVHELAKFWSLDESLVKEVTSESLKRSAKRPPKTGFKIMKAQIELGYKPKIFREGLKLVAEQLKNVF